MVSTRNHPRAFPPPDLSPTKKSARSTASPEADIEPVVYIPASGKTANNAIISSRSGARVYPAWTHTASNFVFAWIAVSLPLVIWDVGYCLLRPHSMPGGKWHLPFWGPYAHYVTIDYLYGFEALARNDGFTGAQSAMNVVETALYLVYTNLVLQNGVKTGNGLERKVGGRVAGLASLIAFSAFVMTLAKTVLYAFVGYYGGWHTLKDNDWSKIIFLFVIPNGAWIVVPGIFTFIYGFEILEGLERAAGIPAKKLE